MTSDDSVLHQAYIKAMTSITKRGILAQKLSRKHLHHRVYTTVTKTIIQRSIKPIEYRYRESQHQLRYKQLGGLHGGFYSDTCLHSNVPSMETCVDKFL
jgi:hypothetical protein